ncbi:MAG: hypothetical protein ACE5G7_01935 [Candidatus Hydrothermarchaeaceae archaeon]
MTTVQVSKTTLGVLKQLKKRHGFKSYDEVIQKLAGDAMRPKESLFGVLGKKSRAEILQGLRDEGFQ